MKKNISRNPLWPDWYNGKKIDEVQFGRAFLEQWPLKCVNGTLYTLDGPVEDESEIKQRILENIEDYVTSGLSKKVTNILETIIQPNNKVKLSKVLRWEIKRLLR